MNRTKLPRKVKTINDVLARDDINKFLADMDNEKANIKQALIIYVRRDDSYSWEISEGIPDATVLGLLEQMKYDILSENTKKLEDDDGD